MIPILFYIALSGLTFWHCTHDAESNNRHGKLHFFMSMLLGWLLLPVSVFDTVLKLREELARIQLKENRLDRSFGDILDL